MATTDLKPKNPKDPSRVAGLDPLTGEYRGISPGATIK
jgi:hypothetical protein